MLQDQAQYWAGKGRWAFTPVAAFAEAFAATQQGRANVEALDAPHDTRAKDAGLDPLARTKCVLVAVGLRV